MRPFSLQYNWCEGSVPPPDHYEITITVDSTGRGQMTMVPDYPGDEVPVWSESFTVPPRGIRALWHVLTARSVLERDWQAVEDPPIGGSLEWLHIVVDDQPKAIPTHPIPKQEKAADAVYAAVRSLVPQEIWDKLGTQRRAYIGAQEV